MKKLLIIALFCSCGHKVEVIELYSTDIKCDTTYQYKVSDSPGNVKVVSLTNRYNPGDTITINDLK